MGACAGLALVGAIVGLLVPGRRSAPAAPAATAGHRQTETAR
jgi:hypothetical protein